MNEFWMVLVVLLIGLAFYTFRILREYERGVIFFLGRFQTVKGPGLIIVIPGIQQIVKVELRTKVYDVPSQDVISRDNVSVKVSAVIYFRVVDPEKAIINVEDFFEATSQLAHQSTTRCKKSKPVLKREHASQTSGRELTDTVPDHHLRAETPSCPLTRQRPFDRFAGLAGARRQSNAGFDGVDCPSSWPKESPSSG